MLWVLLTGAVLLLLGAALPVSAMILPSTSEWFGRFPYHTRTTKKILALTFDDGPNGQYTEHILDTLRRHGIHATFFLVGKNVERYPEITRTMLNDGHCIGNHTYSHSFWTYFSKSKFLHEVTKTQHVITEVTGTPPALFRPPWLFRLPWILRALKRLQLTPVSATFGYELEVVNQNSAAIARRALQKVRSGCILDFHDGFDAKGGNRQGTAEAIAIFVRAVLAQGYTFVTVPELLKES